MVNPLPPGTILQLLYLRERLDKTPPGKFIEIGPGGGEITRLLLDMGWNGWAYDLESQTVDTLKARFAPEITQGRLVLHHGNYLNAPPAEKVDLVISCMVMEHMEEAEQNAYMKQAASQLKPDGLMIGLVPASPEHWGIEDDIAGHMRRYTRASLNALATATGWKVSHIHGLTYPISNILLPISNFLVRRRESQKLILSPTERTRQSGHRKVPFKTHFASVLGLVLNPVMMYPWHILQKLLGGNENALILYFEAKRDGSYG